MSTDDKKKTFWDFVRKVHFMRQLQQKYYQETDAQKKRALLKQSKAIEREVDERIEEIFKEYPDQKPGQLKQQEQQSLIFPWLAL